MGMAEPRTAVIRNAGELQVYRKRQRNYTLDELFDLYQLDRVDSFRKAIVVFNCVQHIWPTQRE